MSARSRLRSFVSALVRRRRLENDMAEEWRHHLESRAEALEADGLTRAEALRRARLEFGDPLRWREQGREARGLGWIQDVGADVRYAFRQMRRMPGFTVIVITTFALGIGSTTAIFSAVDAVVLRALPFDEHNRLVAVGPAPRDGSARAGAFTPQDFLDWRAQQDVFEPFAGITVPRAMNLQQPDRPPENVRAVLATPAFFEALRTAPVMGRTFAPDPDVRGQPPEAVLSYGFWQRIFGGDPKALGASLRLQETLYAVVGVMPPSFSYPVDADPPTDLWVTFAIPDEDRVRAESRNFYMLAIGRLKEGVAIGQAEARMTQLSVGIAAANPAWGADTAPAGARVVPLIDQVVGDRTRSWMLLLLGAVLTVLVTACVNVAGLTLVRGSARQQELAVRAAIGAGRWRIVRQMLVETVVLSMSGAAIGIVLARWGVEILRTAMPADVPRVASIALDLRVLSLAVVATFVAGIASGLMPAWQSSRPDLTTSLAGGGRSASTTRAGRRARSALVVAELALAVVLLVGAGLFVASFVKLARIDLGFDPRGVLTVGINPGFGDDAMRRGAAALGELAGRLQGAPGVVAAAVATGTTPITNMAMAGRIAIPGRELPPDQARLMAAMVTPQFQRALGITVRSGRFLEDRDAAAEPGAIVLSVLAASKFYPNDDPVGREVQFMGQRRIVGVVSDVRWPEVGRWRSATCRSTIRGSALAAS